MFSKNPVSTLRQFLVEIRKIAHSPQKNKKYDISVVIFQNDFQ